MRGEGGGKSAREMSQAASAEVGGVRTSRGGGPGRIRVGARWASRTRAFIGHEMYHFGWADAVQKTIDRNPHRGGYHGMHVPGA